MSCRHTPDKCCGYQPLPWMSAALLLRWHSSVQQHHTCQHVQPCSSLCLPKRRRCAWALGVCSAAPCTAMYMCRPVLVAGLGWSVHVGMAALASLSLNVRSNSASTCRAPFTRHTTGRSSR